MSFDASYAEGPTGDFTPFTQIGDHRIDGAFTQQIVKGAGGLPVADVSTHPQPQRFRGGLGEMLSAGLQPFTAQNLDTLLVDLARLALGTSGGKLLDLQQPLLSDGQFVWGPNVGAFDIRAFLEARGSPLSAYADDVANWAGYTSVNPQVLLTVLELREGLVSGSLADAHASTVPQLIENTALDLATYFYDHLHTWGDRRPPMPSDSSQPPIIVFADGSSAVLPNDLSSATAALLAVLAKSADRLTFEQQIAPRRGPGTFVGVFEAFFPETDRLDPSNDINPAAPPPDALLQFPFPLGATWTASGPHSWNGGSFPPPFSSIDFFIAGGTCAAPPNLYTVAAADGTVYRPYDYSCWLEINHGGGWVTSYYHLRNTYSGAPLGRNSKIGTIACETCAGGFATGPHVHFSLKYNGAYVSLEGVKLSGWTVHVGAQPYTSGYFERENAVLLAYSQVLNDYHDYFGGMSSALRFYGNGSGDIDRVKIRMTDLSLGPPADVGAQNFTIEWWMKTLSAENLAGTVECGLNDNWRLGNIILDRDRADQDRDYGVSMADGKLVFGVGGEGTGEFSLCGSTTVADGEWHHVAVQRRRTDGWMWIFVDGLLDAQADGPDGDISYPAGAVPLETCNGPCVNDPFLVIGAEKHGVDPGLLSFVGTIDEIRMSNTLRYFGGFPRPGQPFSPDLNTVALYHFDEYAGLAAFDVSGYSGGPSNGSLKIGGSPEGPTWVSSNLFLPFRYYFPYFATGP